MGRVTRAAAACLAVALVMAAAPGGGDDAAAAEPRVDLRVLLVDDGGPATAAIGAELDGAGTPYTTIDLNRADRPRIDEDFLSGTADGRDLARYQSVVLPNDNPFGDGSPEMAALAAYEKRFGVPQVDAYTYARPDVGLEPAADAGYSGPLDGRTAKVTAEGKAGPFGYLRGDVPFEDNDPDVAESYGYLSPPLARQQEGATYTSYVDAPLPGGSGRGSLVGEYARDGRRELVVTFVYHQHQRQYRLLARGIVAWMTGGVHLGADRNYFAVHVDDVLAPNARWDTELNCTPGSIDCGSAGGGAGSTPIRMTPADAAYARDWSADRGLTLDLAYNAGGSDAYAEGHGGNDPLADRLIADQESFRWINHTYDHAFLGCERDSTVVPWRCATDVSGAVRWTSGAEIRGQVQDNLDWAGRRALAVEPGELVTGEHSGLRSLPQQPDDNPELAPALTATGVTSLAADNSRENRQRAVGPALTVPRYPMNIFYNVGRAAEQTDEYNWIYARKADGGSGTCETSPETTTCLDAPLDPDTGYASYIAPLEARIGLGHALANDPRPHFLHQSNLAEDRIAYTVLDRVLIDYRALFTDSAPLVNLRMKDIGTELRKRADWTSALDGATAYRVGGTVTIDAPSGTDVPATMPRGTLRTQSGGSAPFGSDYAGSRSGWTAPAQGEDAITLTLGSGSVPPGGAPVADGASAPRVQAPAPGDLPVPAGVAEPVPYGPGRTARP